MEMYGWIDATNRILWSYLLIVLLLGCAVWFTLRTRFVQFRMIREMVRVLGESASTPTAGAHRGEKHISSFQAFAVSLASRVGTGNLAGVATAIVVGGPGAVFWMWVIALLGASSAFVESTLAQLYKRRGRDSYIGGPAYYMQQGLGLRWMGLCFAVLISVTFGFAFNSVQSNTICAAWEGAFGFDPAMTGIVLTLLTLWVIFGGIRHIARVSSIIVPMMALGYILLALGVVLFNIGHFAGVVELIVANAFGWEQALGGGVGAALMQGIKRGLFSNEAGMGSAPNVAATAQVSHPVKQGLIQMLGVFTDTLVICTCTAFIILFSGAPVDGTVGGRATYAGGAESGNRAQRRDFCCGGDPVVCIQQYYRQLLLRRGEYPVYHGKPGGAVPLPVAGGRYGSVRRAGNARSGVESGRYHDGIDDPLQPCGDRFAREAGFSPVERLYGAKTCWN